MSILDDLFGGVDTTASDAAWDWRKAVMDMINAEYPGIQDWLNSGYNQAIDSTNNVYGMINDRLGSSLDNQINVLSMVPGMTFNTLANGYNHAGNMLMGAPGSMINAPSGGYQVPTYGGYQPNFGGYSSMLGGVSPGFMAPGNFSQASPGFMAPQAAQVSPGLMSASPGLMAPQASPGFMAPQASPGPQSSMQASEGFMAPQASPGLRTALPALSGTVSQPPPGGFTENVDGNFTRKPGLDNTVDRIYNGPQTDSRINTGMGASEWNPLNLPKHRESYEYKALTAAGVDAESVFKQALERGVDPMRLVYESQDPDLLRRVAQHGYLTEGGTNGVGAKGAMAGGIPELARIAGVSTDQMQSYLNGGQFVSPYQNRDSIINLPEESRSTRTPEWFAARGEAPAPRNEVNMDPGYMSPQDRAYNERLSLQPSFTGTVPDQPDPMEGADLTPEEMDRLQSIYGASSPAQGVRPQTSQYSPLQAAINATRNELRQNPGNTFAQQKLAEMEARAAASAGGGGGISSALTGQMPSNFMAPQSPTMAQASLQAAPGLQAGPQAAPQVSPGLQAEAMQAAPGLMANNTQAAANMDVSPGFQAQPPQVSPGLQAQPPQVSPGFQAPQSAQVSPGLQAQNTAPVNTNEFPWQGPQTYGAALPGTGLYGSNSTLNATLNSANNNLAAGGQSAVNAISTGLSQGRNDLMALGGYALSGLSPYQRSGSAANSRMADLNGLNGNAAQQSAIQGVMASPEFDFYRDEGQQAVLRNSAALGGLRGGNVQKDLVRFGQGLASTQYGNHYNRLAGMSGQGLQAAGAAGGIASGMGSDLFRGALGGATTAAGIIRDTASQQAGNTMGTGGMIAGNQYGVGQMLGNMAWGGVNTIAGQFPGLAQAASGAYQNYGNVSANAGMNLSNALSGLYTGQGGAMANNAYNRWNAAQGLGTFPGVQQTPGILPQVGNALGGFGSFYNNVWG